MTKKNDVRIRLVVLLSLSLSLVSWTDDRPLSAQAPRGEAPSGLRRSLERLRTSRFDLRTDLSKSRADQSLSRMESTLRIAAGYWGAPPRGQMTCYLVDDLDNWDNVDLPHPLARVWIRGVEGITYSRQVPIKRTTRNESYIYASSRPGVIEHEIVHAYCSQTFGQTGPDWYKEGMAQVISDRAGRDSHPARSDTFASLRGGRSIKPIREIITGGRFTRDVSEIYRKLLNDRPGDDRQVPVKDWTSNDDDTVLRLREDYLWSWALCHLLCNNPNYADRFRLLGQAYLTRGDDSFDALFGGRGEQLEFEYRFFVRHADLGYRVDLCRWEWERTFRSLNDVDRVACRVEAAKGFQASGLSVNDGTRYKFTTDGTWTMSPRQPATGAAGAADGAGALLGVLLRDGRLSESFRMGAGGCWTAPADGDLFLRCDEDLCAVADNTGSVRVVFGRAGVER